MKRAKSLKKIDASTLAKAVDEAAAVYAGARGVAGADLHMAAKELKQNWAVVKRELAPSAAVKKTVKKAASTVGLAKKTVKKAVKKAKKSVKTVKKAAKKARR